MKDRGHKTNLKLYFLDLLAIILKHKSFHPFRVDPQLFSVVVSLKNLALIVHTPDVTSPQAHLSIGAF